MKPRQECRHETVKFASGDGDLTDYAEYAAVVRERDSLRAEKNSLQEAFDNQVAGHQFTAAKLSEAEQHAKRYRWLRSHSYYMHAWSAHGCYFEPGYQQTKPETLDGKIDEQMEYPAVVDGCAHNSGSKP